MRCPSDERVREFLGLTLRHWGLDASVEPGSARVVAVLRFADARIDVERAASDDPFRWYVCRFAAHMSDPGTSPSTRRPCGSLVGVLGALRRMLDIDSGGPARVIT